MVAGSGLACACVYVCCVRCVVVVWTGQLVWWRLRGGAQDAALCISCAVGAQRACNRSCCFALMGDAWWGGARSGWRGWCGAAAGLRPPAAPRLTRTCCCMRTCLQLPAVAVFALQHLHCHACMLAAHISLLQPLHREASCHGGGWGLPAELEACTKLNGSSLKFPPHKYNKRVLACCLAEKLLCF